MNKHTPGPWRVAGNLSIYAAGQVPIAAPMYAGKDEHEIAANARLIAAAPDLLDALGRFRDLVADDAAAITFQTIGQYRTALLAALEEVA